MCGGVICRRRACVENRYRHRIDPRRFALMMYARNVTLHLGRVHARSLIPEAAGSAPDCRCSSRAAQISVSISRSTSPAPPRSSSRCRIAAGGLHLVPSEQGRHLYGDALCGDARIHAKGQARSSLVMQRSNSAILGLTETLVNGGCDAAFHLRYGQKRWPILQLPSARRYACASRTRRDRLQAWHRRSGRRTGCSTRST